MQNVYQMVASQSSSFFFFIPLAIPSRLYGLFNHNGPTVHLNLHLALRFPLNLARRGWGRWLSGLLCQQEDL